jgi:hypothetical protein
LSRSGDYHRPFGEVAAQAAALADATGRQHVLASEIVRFLLPRRGCSCSEEISGGDILVGFDEFANRRRKRGIVRQRERIDAKIVLQPRDQDRERERVESGVLQRQLIVKRR